MSILKKIWRGPKLEKDKRFAWLILAMSFLSHAVHLGFTYAVIGNLTVVHQSFFNIDLQLSSFIGSVHGGVLFIFAPIASVLVKKVGCRVSEILGGTCLILGIGLSYFSTQPWHAFLLFGVLAGIGASNVYVATSEVLALNFLKYKYLAFSLAVLGYYVGMVVFPIVSQKLLDQLGYSKAMAIMSSFHIVHIVAGLTFFQPSDDQTSEANSTDNELTAKDDAAIVGDNVEMKTGHDNPALDASQIDLTTTKGEKNMAHVLDPQEETGNQQIEQPVVPNQQIEQPVVPPNSLKQDFVLLLKSSQVWAILFNAFLWNLNVASFLILFNDFAVYEVEVTEDEAALGVTIIGIANIVGTVLVILVSSLKFDRLILHFCCTTTFGVSTIITGFSTDKIMLYIVSAIWGLAQGASIANLLSVLDDFCDPKQLALLFGLNLFTEGLGALGGAPLCGYLSEKYGAQYGIILAGCSGVAGSLCILPVIIKRVRARYRSETKASETINTKL